VVGVQAAGDKAERNTLVGLAFDLARTEDACGIAVEKQAKQDFWRNGHPTYGAVVCINPTQIQLCDHIHDEARQVVRRQGFAHGDREIECGFVIGSLELSGHAYILPQTR